MNNNVQEIDLLDLFLKGVLYIRNNIKQILVFAVFGAILGLSYYYIQPEKYTQEIIGFSPVVNQIIIKESIQEIYKPHYKAELQKYCKNKTLLENINSISNVSISELNSEKQDMLKIEFQSKKPLNKHEIKQITKYNLTQNQFISRSLQNKSGKLNSIIAFIDTEIQNKLKEENESGKAGRSLILDNQETPTSLFIQKKDYEEELSRVQAFVFSQINESYSSATSLLILMFAGSFLGILLVISIHFMKVINKLLKRIPKKGSELLIYSKTA